MQFLTKYRRRIILPALGGLALIGLGGVALAKPPGDGPGAKGRRGAVCEQLACTDQQKEDLAAIMTELRSDSKADREAIERLHQTLATEFAKDQPDEKAMKAALQQIAVHEQELRDRGFDAMMEIHDLLDAEQRAKLVKMIERKGLRGLLHGHHGKRGDGDGKRGDGDGKRGDGDGKKQ